MAIQRPLRLKLVLSLLLITRSGLHGQQSTMEPYTPLPRPTLTIGAEGDPDYEFLMIGALLRLPTGSIAVADWRNPRIRIFDSTGQFLRNLGRQGAGPGEFRAVHALFLAGDTLIAYDWHLRRLTRFLPTGALLSTQNVQPAAADGPVDLVGRLANGRWLVTTPHAPDWMHGPGVYRDTLRVGTVAPSSTGPVRWIGTFPGMTFFAYMPSQDKSRWAVGPLPVAPTTLVGALGDTIVVGDTGVPGLQYFLSDGSAVRRLPIPTLATPDLRRQREVARDEALAQAADPGGKPYILASYDAPRTPPRYHDFTIAADGDLWVRLFEETPADSTRYLVLTRAGQVRARLALAPRSRVLTVQPPWILVAVPNMDDVEQVAVIQWAPH
jgi:hypothetical protein